MSFYDQFNPVNVASNTLNKINGGDPGKPYDAAQSAYDKYIQQTKSTQNPFYNAGTSAIPKYQDWVDSQKNPTEFVNKIMADYKESPFAMNERNQAERANTNAASASGLTGSTPFQLQGQANAANIASGDQQAWLDRVLGINTQYGQGEHNLIDTGQHSADELTNTYNNAGQAGAELAYGKGASENNNRANQIAMLVHLLTMAGGA